MSLQIDAPEGSIASKVLLPGDPLRAKHIAETYLGDAQCYSSARGMNDFTGYYQGKRISVQGIGMSMPSMGIYASELMTSYGIRAAIRSGTCGSIQPSLKLRDLVFAATATTDSNMNHDRLGSISFAPCATFGLLRRAYEAAESRCLKPFVGNVFTSDKSYDDRLEEKPHLSAVMVFLR